MPKISRDKSEEQAEAKLGPLGREALRFLREERPGTYKRLAKADRLNRYALERQEAAEASIGRLVANGVNPDEAYGIVAGQYLQLPDR